VTRWNPSDPALVGPEFLGAVASTVEPGAGSAAVQRFRSTATETISNLRLHRLITRLSMGSGQRFYVAEVFPAGDEVDPDLAFTVATFAPNASLLTGAVYNHTLFPADHTGIDEWPPSYSDYIIFPKTDPGTLDLEFASAALNATGRIAAVAVEVVTWLGTASSETKGWTTSTTVALRNGGSTYGSITRTVPLNNTAGTAGRMFFNWGEINPITGLPWTQADVAAFDTSTTRVRLASGQPGSANYTAAVRLVVVYETSERRLARGAFATGDGVLGPAWSDNIALASPAGAANWAKVSDTNYALTVRRADRGLIGGSDSIAWTALYAVAGEEPPIDLPSYTTEATTISHLVDNNATLASQVASSEVLDSGRVLAFVLRTNAGATSVDGQPYAGVRTAAVHTSSLANQGELRTTASDDYGRLNLVVGAVGGVAPTAALVVEVVRRSDNVTMGTFTFPAALMGDVSGSLQQIEVESPSPVALVAGTQYYLNFLSSTAATAPWVVAWLAVEAGGGGVLYQEATYSGGTDEASPIDGAASTTLTTTPGDFVGLLVLAVDGPTSVAAVAAEQALPALPASDCAPPALPYASLTWGATAHGSLFARYRIQRLGADASTWQDVATIIVESVDSWGDHEARIGVQESYRMRVELTDGSASYWSSAVTATLPSEGCGLWFTNNDAQPDGVAYTDVYRRSPPLRGFEFPEADEVTYQIMYGRDLQVAFRPLSRRGVTFQRRLLVEFLGAADPVFGIDALDALRDLAWATLPYLCVRDEAGNRWFGSLTVPEGDLWQSPAGAWAEVEFVETVQTPAVVEVTEDVAAAGDFLFVSGDVIELVGGGALSLVS